MVDETPLQVYYGGLLFAPQLSLIRGEFEADLDWICQLPKVEERWSAELQILEGHLDIVKTVAFSPDGAWLASASYDGTVRFWNAATGEPQRTFEVDLGHPYSMALSSDGSQFTASTWTNCLEIWDTATGVLQHTLEGHSDSFISVTFSQDGAWLASSSEDRTIHLWDKKTGVSKYTLKGHSGYFSSLAFSPNGAQLASGCRGGTVQIWDVATGLLQQSREGHLDHVSSVVFSPDSAWLASSSRDRTIRLWDMKTGVSKYTLQGHSDWVLSIAFSPDGAQLASASADNTICVWDTLTGSLRQTLVGSPARSVYSIVFSPSGEQLASACGHSICLWDISTGMLSESSQSQTVKGHSEAVHSVALSPDGTRLASSASDGAICLWDTRTGALQQTLGGHPENCIELMTFLPSSEQIATCSGECIHIWDIAKSILHNDLKGQTFKSRSKSGFQSIDFSPDGTLLATASGERTIWLWDVATGTLQRVLRGHSDWIYSVAFSSDSTHLASGSEDAVLLWDTATGEVQQTIYVSREVTDLRFGHDGSYFIANRGSFDVKSGSGSPVIGLRDGNRAISYTVGEEWVALNGKNTLWLPPGYRPGHVDRYSISGNALALGLSSGTVCIMRFKV
ncbi:uncharacterized protein N7506_009611 [Penicillium brevicompactum]|uniref:uncharacterized protein n=1 Tax=Penicillium brevicompactum TaxID=5074 RepID=UPI0025424E04|nr:uncharacterized protein N7506_009611 [Penicillium brevicompactum]KAJ5326509.1 hypothetical protein N7506_009611 [Penicillium brevicompactum]